MNGKKAKALRKIARENTIGLPQVCYVQSEKTGQIRLGKCTRLFEKKLKKLYKDKKVKVDEMVAPTGSSPTSS